MSVSMARIVGDAFGKLGGAASVGLTRLVGELATPPSRAQQRAMYERLGEATRTAVVETYDSEIGENPHARYRGGTGKNQRLTGRLRPLLAGNVGGTIYRVVNAPNSNGGVRIELFNPKAMNARAQHWARLNFGAGAAGLASSPARTYQIGLRGAGQTVGFRTGPRPAFRIPKGWWFEGGENVPPGMPVAGSAFYLRPITKATAAPQTPMITRGIGARRFLDAGLDIFARQVSPAFNELVREQIGSRSRLRFHDTVVGRAS